MISRHTAERSSLQMLALRLDEHVDRVLFVDEHGQSWRYEDAVTLSADPSFQAAERQLVFCLAGNTPHSLLGYLSLLRANAVQVLLTPAISSGHLQELIDLYRPTFFWLPADRVRHVGDTRECLKLGDYHLRAVMHRHAADLHTDLSLMLTTSGSTGSPKLVRLSHANLLANAESIVTYLTIDADERPITTLPPSYSFGLSVLHSHVLAGASIVVSSRSILEPAFWGFLESQRATSFAGVPYHYQLLRKLLFIRHATGLRTLTQAGGHMSRELAFEFAQLCQDHKMQLFCMYGQTEATARMAFLSPEKALSKAGAIGQAIPGGQLWLRDDSGHLIERSDEVGELIYSGRNVCLGYADSRQDLIRGDDNRGVLATGDLARRDSDGDYTIVGRLNRFLKVFGSRVNLHEVELALGRAGYEVVCCGQDDSLDIFLRHSTPRSALDIKSFVVLHLRLPPTCIRIYRIDDFPLTSSGKVHYSILVTTSAERLL
jgi:acyl-CoA synthetase (AMP-forming)/AMP-acid ligase II